MSSFVNIDPEYREWIQELSTRFRQSQIKAAMKVNTELVRFYWSLGEDLLYNQFVKKVPQVVAQLKERDQDNLSHELFSIPWGPGTGTIERPLQL